MTEDELVFEEPLEPSARREFLNSPRWGLMATLVWIITRDVEFSCRASAEAIGYEKAGRWLALDRAWKKEVRRDFPTLSQAWANALAPAFTQGIVTAICSRASFSANSGRQVDRAGFHFPPQDRPALAEACVLRDVGGEAYLFEEGYFAAEEWAGWHQIAISSEQVRNHWRGEGPLQTWQSEKVIAEQSATPLEKARAAFVSRVKAWPANNHSYPNKQADIAWIRANVPEAAAIGNTKLAALRREVLESNGHDQFQSAWLRQGRRS